MDEKLKWVLKPEGFLEESKLDQNGVPVDNIEGRIAISQISNFKHSAPRKDLSLCIVRWFVWGMWVQVAYFSTKEEVEKKTEAHQTHEATS